MNLGNRERRRGGGVTEETSSSDGSGDGHGEELDGGELLDLQKHKPETGETLETETKYWKSCGRTRRESSENKEASVGLRSRPKTGERRDAHRAEEELGGRREGERKTATGRKKKTDRRR